LPTDKRIFEEFKAHQNDEGFVAEKFFTFHPDQQINSLACDLIADRYQLSSIFSKVAISENVVLDVEQRSEHDLLVELVPQLLCELRLSLVNDRIDAVQQQMKADPDGEQSLQLLGQLNSLNVVKREICKYLGNRMR
jgi:DNA primase